MLVKLTIYTNTTWREPNKIDVAFTIKYIWPSFKTKIYCETYHQTILALLLAGF